MAKVKITVSIAENHLNQILDVTQDLRSAGMEVEHVMDGIGVVTGAADADQISAIAQVPGVSSVEREQSFQLPSPDSPIQ
ncbi:MAG TPA: ketohydroxyglutarate aldolase [Synechococcales cyanobacterium M55_K2018_004]|nr:ketohydroxyglutarate aldolase [Synechococcales cyanobacterium M55_K2018_004]